MWVRKIPAEIAKERNTLWGRLSSLMQAAFLGFCLGAAVMSGGRYGPRQPSTSTGLLVAVVVGLLAIIAAHLLQLRFGKPLFSKHLWLETSHPFMYMGCQICDTCHRVRSYDRQEACECSGKFEDLDDWKLVDD